MIMPVREAVATAIKHTSCMIYHTLLVMYIPMGRDICPTVPWFRDSPSSVIDLEPSQA